MKTSHLFATAACVFGFCFAAFTLSATAEGDPAASEVTSVKEMNGYALEDYADFWKNPNKWHFVTVRYRKDSGEMRLTYANDIAWKALLAGGKDYPDGAVFGKVGLLTHEDPAFTSSAVPSGARRYQLMIKDKKKWPDTDGWGYALFDWQGLAVREDQDIAAQACHACHALVPERDYVFSEPFRLEIGAKAPVPQAEALPRISFETISFSELPEKAREKMPEGLKQARLVQVSPALAPATVALNTSAMYGGQELGAALGGVMIAQGRMLDLHEVGLVVMLAAMALSVWAARLHAGPLYQKRS